MDSWASESSISMSIREDIKFRELPGSILRLGGSLFDLNKHFLQLETFKVPKIQMCALPQFLKIQNGMIFKR